MLRRSSQLIGVGTGAPKSWKPMHFEIEPRAVSLNMRLPAPLLDVVKARAKARGIPYTRYVRMLLETDVAR
jgi:predicted DNA binding CopG/RHH family protein